MARHERATTTADRLIRAADADAERTLGIVRMSVAATLAAALVLAVSAPGRPEDPDLARQIFTASAVIACYFALGLATYLICRRGRYAPWMAWATATLDVALIAGNVWVNLQAAGINSMLLFSFPAAMMLPIVLTFGSLRFRPAVQIWTTVLMAAALTAILFSDFLPLPTVETLPERVATTFAPPPNLVRIVMVAAVGVVIAVAVWRARALLRQVAGETERRRNLTRFLPAGVAADMSDGAIERLRDGRIVELGIMFVDIRGFTALSESLPPDELAALLGPYRRHIADAAAAEGGVVDKFIGDGALVIFGLESDAQAAAGSSLRAAADIAARLDRWNAERSAAGKPPVRFGVGVHLGPVTIGAIGGAERLEFTVLGDTVNVAARVEALTKIAGARILASDVVVQSAGAPAGWRDLGEQALPGRAAPVRVWAYDGAI